LLGYQSLIRFSDLAYLSFILLLEHLHGSSLILILFILQNSASLLQLLKSQLELSLAVSKVSLVIFFLLLQEHYFSLPQSFVSIVVRLKVLEFAFAFLKLALQSKHVLGLRAAEIKSLSCRL